MINRRWIFIGGLLITAVVLIGCVRPADRVETNPPAADGTDSGDTSPSIDPPETTDDGSASTDAGSDTAETDSGDTSETDTGDTSETSDSASTDTSDDTSTDSSDSSSDTSEEDSSAATDSGDDSTTDAGSDDSADSSSDDTASQTETPTEEGETSAEDPAATSPPAEIPAEHTVQAGENLYRIGLLYNMSWKEIARANRINRPYYVFEGQVLKIPGGGQEEPPPPENGDDGDEDTYVVQKGDTLYSIGKAKEISWVLIAEANGIKNPNRIYVGDVLKIPTSTTGPTPQFTHIVKKRETLWKIAIQYGVSWPAIAEENNISSPYTIFVGQELTIPSSE